MDIESELAELLTALDAVTGQVEQWESPAPSDTHRAGAPGPARATVSGQGPDAVEERAIRGAAAALARERAREVRGELAAIREQAKRMAGQTRRARDPPPTAPAAEAAVGTALRSAAAQLIGSEDSAQTMERIVTGALQLVPRARWGGIYVQGRAGAGRSEVSPHAASDPILDRLEGLQARDGEGPCVQALSSTAAVYVPDLLLERRWPSFARLAVDLGVRSVLAVGLPVAPPLGVLNLYSPYPDAFGEQARAVVEVFADHAAIALAGARRVGQLQRAVESRDLIGQAKGVLMHHRGVDAERAFQMLVDASQQANLKLVAVARWTVDHAHTL